MLFGRAQEEIAALEAAGVPYEVVPGVTAALAAAADLGTSLTQRGSVRSFAFVTPRIGVDEDPSRWVDAMRGADAGAIYMGSREAPAIAAALIATGYPPTTPVAIVEDASLPTSRVSYTTIAGLAVTGAASDAPTLLLVGPQFHARERTVAVSGAEAETLSVAAG